MLSWFYKYFYPNVGNSEQEEKKFEFNVVPIAESVTIKTKPIPINKTQTISPARSFPEDHTITYNFLVLSSSELLDAKVKLRKVNSCPTNTKTPVTDNKFSEFENKIKLRRIAMEEDSGTEW